jgi:rare lipoprotein A
MAGYRVALAAVLLLLPVGTMAETGIASWYQCCNPKTACGVSFRPDSPHGAAHKTLPCGTKVRVTRLDTGKSITVTIVDRGPFVRGRVIDLYRGAASRIGMGPGRRGTARVRLQILN